VTARTLHLRRLGRVEYPDGLAAQKLLVAARAQGLVPDTLLLLEHPRVITLGRGAKEGHLLAPRAELAARGYEIYDTDRGGDVTYHGPGQIVGYPVLDLKPDRKDVRKYVASVEEVMIRVAAGFGLTAERIAGRTGVWTPAGKLGAIGVHISRWITSHGFAFNVRTDLADFAAIVPCGIADAGVTSLQLLLGEAPPMEAVEDSFAASAEAVWESELLEVPPELRTISAVLQREDGRVLLLKRTPARGGFWQILTGRVEPGESALSAAAREIFEETGFSPRLEELRNLNYVHSFPLDPAPGKAPIFAQETAFACAVRGEPLLGDEHDDHRWCTPQEAQELLPYAGLRRAVHLATLGG
jgi:lipoyl(octanoyl) transferase